MNGNRKIRITTLVRNNGNQKRKRKANKNRLQLITGCVVAQHCYNGGVSFLWEKLKR